MPQRHTPSNQAEKLDRFHQLENTIRHCTTELRQVALQKANLNEYIDIGLDMATKAGITNHPQLQESWLKRVYNTLFETTSDMVEPEYWREVCSEYLYQPLFALKHLYRNHPHGKRKIQMLYKELSVTAHYLY
jgi:hypothetical protein|tara:strand:+ start:165 stop:563 length:399 start_codon:yes stop_codon:yes gene_type:complete